MMRVVLTGIFYPMAILRYFEAALRRREDVELFTAGPYTGTRIPWGGGMDLPGKYAGAPDLPIPVSVNTQAVPLQFVEARLPWQPDLWVQIDAGFHLHGKPNNGRNVIVATDPHVLNYDRQRRLADTFYCMQACYAKNGDEYLPYAYDPIWHKVEEQPHNYDAALLGLHYPQRDTLVARLVSQGLRVLYDLGPSFDEARALYNQSPIGLNWSSKQDLVARVFELLGMGLLAVVNRVPDLERFFEDGRDLIIFDSMDEAVWAVLHYHEWAEEAKAIAAKGHRTVRPHTWDARVGQILGGM